MRGAAYYAALCGDDYYHAGMEPPGVWIGEGCKDFGLSGEVKKDEFIHLLDGFSPDGKEKLVQNAGKRNRQAGIDITFSAPKSVSVLWSQADEKTRAIIEACHERAVREALRYLEFVGGLSRVGKDGAELERVSLLFAAYQHGTSRAQDPQLHTHCVLVNVCKREDGSTGTIITKPMFENKMTGGAIYRAELAAALEQELGLVVEREQGSARKASFRPFIHKGGLIKPGSVVARLYEKAVEWQKRIREEHAANKGSLFEIRGVSRELMKEFSKRRQQIETVLEARGEKGAAASQEACVRTRPRKEILPRSELFSRWHEVGREHGWSEREAATLVSAPKRLRNPTLELEAIFSRAIARATANEIYFRERDLLRHACEEAQGTGVSARDVRNFIGYVIDNSGLIDRIPDQEGRSETDRLITWEMVDLEKKLLTTLEASKKEPFRFDVGKRAIEEATARLVTAAKKSAGKLSEEQAAAVKHITTGQGTIRVVAGMAGTGKSTMLKAAREIWEKQGRRVIGAALAGKAAEGLLKESGIKSTTVAGLLASIEGGWTKLTRRSVVVIDEAGMIGTRTMAKLIQVTQKKGARLILVGDERQLQPIEAGSPFKLIGDTLGRVTLTEIRRQREKWARDAVHDFAEGNAKEALIEFAKRGFVTVTNGRAQAMRSLIDGWRNDGVLHPEKNLILAGTNAEVGELNILAQWERLRGGALKKRNVELNGAHIYENDRILFTRRAVTLGIENGSFAQVLSISKRSLIAKLDSGKTVTIPLSKYQDISLGYAVTTHKAQGITVENAMVLLGGTMQDREISYVQASRARGDTHFYIDRNEAGQGLSKIAEMMTQSRQKTTILEMRRALAEHAERKHDEPEQEVPPSGAFKRETHWADRDFRR